MTCRKVSDFPHIKAAQPLINKLSCLGIAFVCALLFVICADAHPLGNFTVNDYTRIEVGAGRVKIRYVLDMAEIATLQELQKLRHDQNAQPSQAELDAYAARAARELANNLALTINEKRVPLEALNQKIGLPPGAGGLPTLRLECEFAGAFDASKVEGAANENAHINHLRFENLNNRERIGWHEIVLTSTNPVALFDSNAFANGVTDEIKLYPENMLAAPLSERTAEASFTTGALPPNAKPIRTRDGKIVAPQRDRLAEPISVPQLTLGVALFGLLLAAGLGSVHAFSPGHGKTVVGAYLVGSRGTWRHAAFLGLTVTVTHTAGVFALGLVTLFASRYVLPEKLYPVLSLVSGGIVLAVGLSLFIKRLLGAFGYETHEHTHDGLDAHTHVHAFGNSSHSHLPPGAAGERVTWKSLLALGVSGGLLPCPSALVVLLAAITLGRTAYGLLLVVAFSCGLALTLTTIGLLFVYAGRLAGNSMRAAWMQKLSRWLPVASALVIATVGAALCYEALAQAGVHLFSSGDFSQFFTTLHEEEPELKKFGAWSVLTLGLVFGLKHATEADHVVAVSTIVSEHRNIFRAALVGSLWGAGHTLSLVVVGFVVVALHLAIPEGVYSWLEFGVALMIIGLGANVLARALLRRSQTVHLHAHRHDQLTHEHIHFHEEDTAHEISEDAAPPAHDHAPSKLSLKPLLVGAMHGLAGSGALTVLVLAQINSVALGLAYLLVFGVGSIAGMLLMSGLIGLPFALSARRLDRFNFALQTLAGLFSVAFGLWYAHKTLLEAWQ